MYVYKCIVALFLFTTVAILAEKVEIVSDAMNAQNVKKRVNFIGHVKIKQVDSWLHADKVIVYFNENNETKKYEAIGSVKFEIQKDKNHYKGKGDKVIYYPNKSEYILIGHAVIDDQLNKRHVAGAKIVFDMVTGNANVKGRKSARGKVKPVVFVFDDGKDK